MKKRIRDIAIVIATIAAAASSGAQSASDGFEFEKTYQMYKTAIMIAAGALILFLVGGFFFKRWANKRDREPFGFADLSNLEKRGLLTPEEAKKVRDALVRQTMQRANSPRTSLKGDEALLFDEEVRRLEALAQAKRAQKEKGEVPAAKPSEQEEIPAELQAAVAKGLLSQEEALAIARRAKSKSQHEK